MATLNINDTTPEVDYTAIAAQTDFSVPFEFFDDADLVVLVDGAVQALNTDYTVTGAEVDGGGSITFSSGLSGGELVRIYTDIAIARDVEYVHSGNLSHEVLERDFQQRVRVDQQLERDISRAIRLMKADTNVSMELPLAADRANKYLAFGASGELEVAEEVTGTTLSQSVIGGYLWPRTAAEIAAGVTPAYYYYEPGVVERYGAVGDGATDDYTAIQAAFDQLKQTGGADVVFQSRHIYKIDTGLTAYVDNGTIHGNGARIQHSADICPLTLGELGSGKSMARSRILGGIDLEYTGSFGTSTKPGVQIYQSIEGDYHFNSILNYQKGIYMTATSGGCAYNKVHFDRIKNCSLYGIHQYGDTGYVNENKFYCGRFTMVGSGGWHIYNDREASSSYPPNHHTYYSPCMEMSSGSDMDGYVCDDGQFNTYFEPRLELGGTETINETRIRFDTTSKWNCVYGGYNFDGDSIDDQGEHNRWFMRDQIKIDAGNAAQAGSIFSGMRAQVNEEEKPACLVQDLYGSNTDGDAMVFKARARRNGADGYYYDAERAGSMVIGLDDGFTYECILAHTSASTDRPGVDPETANWATYWRKLNTKDGGAAWANAASYTAATTLFRVKAEGTVLLANGPTVTTGTATPEGAITAPVGSLFLRTDGSTSTTLYVKTSGTGNTGWTAK